MFRGFCITEDIINEVTFSYFYANDAREKAYEDALKELEGKSSDITSSIASIIQGDASGIINGDALQQACMPTASDKYDVFISHSHNSEDCAKDLAAYLKIKYGVRCFVDGFVWGSCDKDILRPIDKKWSKHDSGDGSYSYEKRNFSTSHVHAMLSMALLEMIDQCECCIFIKPEEMYSITGVSDMTLSPWIYEEITMFNKVEKQMPNRTMRRNESFSNVGPRLKIRYKLDLSNMPELKEAHLQAYINDDIELRNMNNYTKAYRWLDYVYSCLK